jgi:hypothetical protein
MLILTFFHECENSFKKIRALDLKKTLMCSQNMAHKIKILLILTTFEFNFKSRHLNNLKKTRQHLTIASTNPIDLSETLNSPNKKNAILLCFSSVNSETKTQKKPKTHKKLKWTFIHARLKEEMRDLAWEDH